MQKWLPTLITVAAGAVAALAPQVQQIFTSHPQAAAIIATVYAIVKGLLPSPVTDTTTK